MIHQGVDRHGNGVVMVPLDRELGQAIRDSHSSDLICDLEISVRFLYSFILFDTRSLLWIWSLLVGRTLESANKEESTRFFRKQSLVLF